MAAATLTTALVTRFRKGRRCLLLLRREALAMRLTSIGQLIERTQEDAESDRLVAAHQQRAYQDELAELVRLRESLAADLHAVRRELAQ